MRRVLPINLYHLDVGLLRANVDPAQRFEEAFSMLMVALLNSKNKESQMVGARLRDFWEVDMEDTIMYTPTHKKTIGGDWVKKEKT